VVWGLLTISRDSASVARHVGLTETVAKADRRSRTLSVTVAPVRLEPPVPASAHADGGMRVRSEKSTLAETSFGQWLAAGQAGNYSLLSQLGLPFRFKTSIPVSYSWRTSRRSRPDRNASSVISSTNSRPSVQATLGSTAAADTVSPAVYYKHLCRARGGAPRWAQLVAFKPKFGQVLSHLVALRFHGRRQWRPCGTGACTVM